MGQSTGRTEWSAAVRHPLDPEQPRPPQQVRPPIQARLVPVAARPQADKTDPAKKLAVRA